MTSAGQDAIEAPSGKGAADENFPVGSLLIAPALRPDVAIYYAFARAIDDIADNPALDPEDKIARLDAMDRALVADTGEPGVAKADQVREMFTRRSIDIAHARDLVSAFWQDSRQSRYRTWDDLMDYCNRSAAPVGRFLLAIHGEDPAMVPASDALCNALQVINHLQDCADDYRDLDRVYLPLDWLDEAGVDETALAQGAASPALRRVIDRCLAGTRRLLEHADRLAPGLASTRLAMESAVITGIAHRLVDELSRRDPLAERVVLSKPQYAICALVGAARGLVRR